MIYLVLENTRLWNVRTQAWNTLPAWEKSWNILIQAWNSLPAWKSPGALETNTMPMYYLNWCTMMNIGMLCIYFKWLLH